MDVEGRGRSYQVQGGKQRGTDGVADECILPQRRRRLHLQLPKRDTPGAGPLHGWRSR